MDSSKIDCSKIVWSVSSLFIVPAASLKGISCLKQSVLVWRQFSDPDRMQLIKLLETDYIFSLPKYIMITSPYNIYPLIPHFYIVKLWCTGVYLFFLFKPLREKTNNLGSDQIQHKLGYTVTEDG